LGTSSRVRVLSNWVLLRKVRCSLFSLFFGVWILTVALRSSPLGVLVSNIFEEVWGRESSRVRVSSNPK
jgi:uncharacterized PurR-regulated membrane protein YhhQ (DUF165 family)